MKNSIPESLGVSSFGAVFLVLFLYLDLSLSNLRFQPLLTFECLQNTLGVLGMSLLSILKLLVIVFFLYRSNLCYKFMWQEFLIKLSFWTYKWFHNNRRIVTNLKKFYSKHLIFLQSNLDPERKYIQKSTINYHFLVVFFFLFSLARFILSKLNRTQF